MLLLFSTTLKAQNNYQNLWEKVYQFEIDDLPKSALNIVDDIYKKAVSDNNAPQLVKTLLYKSKFSLILEEDAQLKIIDELKIHITQNKFPTKNILQNILANLYWQYFNQYRWKFYNRTKTAEKVTPNDFRTWDLKTLFSEIHKQYQASLQETVKLQQVSIYDFEAILTIVKGAKEYRPTLFDFLAHNALEFYKKNETHITKPTYQFKLDNEDLLCEANQFTTTKLKTKDLESLQFNALKIYQELTTFHIKQRNIKALVDIDLERLNFVYAHATFKNRQSQYLETLKTSQNLLSDKSVSGLYSYEIASIYNQLADVSQKNKIKSNKFKNREALNICEQVITKFPNSKAAKKCNYLKAKIKQEQIQITAEKHTPILTFSKVLVEYKNIDTLFFTAYKISTKELEKLNKMYEVKKKVALISSLAPTNKWSTQLRNNNDYVKHTTETIVPKLNQGHYLIVASNDKKLTSASMFGVTNVQITDLAFITRRTNDTYQIVDRNTGKPLKSAKVNFKNNPRYNRDNTIDKTFITDKNGEFSYTPNRYYNGVEVTVTHKKDNAKFGSLYIDRNYKNTNKPHSSTQTFLFTDRSIYRPNQTIHFKGISLHQQKNTSQIIQNTAVTITLRDVNNQVVKEQQLKTNDFGSFSGEFIIPSSVLTGNFTLIATIKGKQSYHYFSIEEYKRPKFEANFNPITKSYKLNDSVIANGFAKAYSGANISEAKVVYRVHRKVQYPRWWYWYRTNFYAEPQEISNGETKTDENGNFTISFKALPDDNVSKKDLPVFVYEVAADVTDINGETRSTTTLIKVGYHALTATVEMVDKVDKVDKSDQTQTVTIETKNLNGEFINASGTVTVYKLKAPKNALRKRTWEAPDYQVIPVKEFRDKFPYDAYTNEDKVINWEKSVTVFTSTFDTKTSKKLQLTNLKKWKSGNYVIELTTRDKFGQSVTDKHYFTVFSKSDKLPVDNEIVAINTNKESYAVGDTAEITVSTNATDITVMLFIEKQYRIVASHYIHLNRNSKTIKIPIQKNDLGGFGIKYYYVNHNAFINNSKTIAVPYPNTDLELTTNTFRNKLQPGSKQTWSFKVKGNKRDQIAAELLASMYDASLDQFKNHEWSFNPFYRPTYYTSSATNANISFQNTAFQFTNLYKALPYIPNQNYDRLNWFGFSLTNQRWANRRYLRNIKLQRTKFDGKITGSVSDSDGFIPFVNVLIKGTSFGTTTDFDGNFSLKVNKGDVLVFSYIGFKTIEQKVTNFTPISITLSADEAALDEVVVTGVAGNASNIRIRGSAVPMANKKMKMASSDQMEAEADMVMEASVETKTTVTTKETNTKIDFSTVKIRKNLQETAFFYPHLTTDSDGNVSFNFTVPEALTKWKLQLLAHTKALHSATKTLTTVTQKELMITPNAPRFLRQGDKITLSSKISNLTNKQLKGESVLILTDAISGKEINNQLNNNNSQKSFTVNAKGNTSVSWDLVIPETIQAVQYKIIAKAGDFSDGEQNVLPIVSNRMLVTETLPMWIRSNQTKTFTLNKLKNTKSSTLKHHKLSLEVTSNPAWYAVQALPYLMEYPHECAEQTFARFYANTLASYIANSNPKIKEVFEQWKSSKALLSNLEKNQELKSLIIEETPWLRDAQSETEQKKRIALLFDFNKMNNEQNRAIQKLQNIQMNTGGFPWFKGGRYPSLNITNHIATGFGHLQKLGVQKFDPTTNTMLKRAVQFLDGEIARIYSELLQQAKKIEKKDGLKKSKEFLAKQQLSYFTLQYLYMRSFYPNISIKGKTKEAIEYYKKQSITYWKNFNLYGKGLIALVQYRTKNMTFANKILKSLKENSINSEELGMYWKENKAGWYWHQAPIETQALLIEAFSEIENDTTTIDNLKIWLLKNKQVRQWKTTKATSEAVYALLLQGSNWISSSELVTVKIGNKTINPAKLVNTKIEAGTGYFKTSWDSNEINSKMATVSLTKKDKGIAWGGLYWQYFEDLDKITSAKTPLQLSKKLFKKVNTDTGKKLIEVTNTNLQMGDLVTVRIELRSDRAMEFIHMKDMRASAFEPINVLSKYKWQDGLGYYESTKDAATHFFFDRLPKGVYVFEYDVRVNNKGNFSNGITTIQSMYAPEFTSHSKGERVITK